MDTTEARMLEAVKVSFQRSKGTGTRSTRKLKSLHGWIQNELIRRLGDEYITIGPSEHSNCKENVVGKYYNKNVDVCVKRKHDDEILGVISTRFVVSSLQKNTANYFEAQMGETANLRSEDIIFGHIFCIAQPIPVRKTGGKISKWEYVNDSFMDKYRKLAEDRAQKHAPDVQAICVFWRDTKKECVVSWCEEKNFREVSQTNLDYLRDHLGIERFFEKYVSAIKSKSNSIKKK